MRSLINWVDDRLGIRSATNAMLFEPIPGGSSWRRVWGNTLIFAFLVQMVTGLFLWASYSPNAKGAWESVYFIQFELEGGWLLRGIHHFMAQAMIILLVLHFLQIVIDGAYRAPREFNFWTGLILMKLILAMALTGYLLPWDQRGFRATGVATGYMGLTPMVGDSIKTIVVGGSEYGHATLTRFFSLHAGFLPWIFIGFLCLHVYLLRRHGSRAVGNEGQPAQAYWPDQALKNMIACLVVMAGVMFFVLQGYFTASDLPAGLPIEARLGAELGSPADASEAFDAARPEWYFLFLFKLVKYFPQENLIVGVLYIPGLAMGLLFLMPILGRWKLGHGFNVAMFLGLLGGAIFLTGLAVWDDMNDPNFHIAKEEGRALADRAIILAASPEGIPGDGAISMLRNDPKTQGAKLFERNCSSCHAYEPVEDLFARDEMRGAGLTVEEVSAPNLYSFGSKQWIAAFLDPSLRELPDADGEVTEVAPVNSLHFFGGTAHLEGEMAGYITDTMADPDEWTTDEIDAVVTALAAEGGLEPDDSLDPAQIEAGTKLLQDEDRCAGCHKFKAENDYAYAPDLTGYGSRKWLFDFIGNPEAERFYGDSNDRMPAFHPDPHNDANNQLSKQQLEILVDWMRTDWYEPE